jgi:peptidylprolyl isomerase
MGQSGLAVLSLAIAAGLLWFVGASVGTAPGEQVSTAEALAESDATEAHASTSATDTATSAYTDAAIPAENIVVIELKDGVVEIELLPEVAPLHVARMKELARSGQYDNVVFHRVIDGFMAQTGDVANGDAEDGFDLRRAGTGGSDLPNVTAEFSNLPFDRGVLGAARSQHPDSANSQFFIMFADGHFLNGQYTVYGRVISGMEHVDTITRGEPPRSPDRMISVRVKADM